VPPSRSRCTAVYRDERQKGGNLWVCTSYEHEGRARDRCAHPWWGSFQYKGRLHRASLTRWADEKIDSKAKAKDVFDRMCNAIRAGTFAEHEMHADLTFGAFAALYVKRYVELRGLRSRDHVERRLAILNERWQGKRLTDIRVGEIEDLIQDLRTKGARGRSPRSPRPSIATWLCCGT
jgi:hypothetical protein